MADGDRERRVVFGEVADVYERVRPSYPPELVDDVVSFASVSPGDRYLELMQTHSDHRLLDDDDRHRLLEAIGGVIAGTGSAITIEYVTRLYLARRS